MNDDQFEALNSQLDTIIKLLALEATEGKTLKTQVALLSGVGLQPKQIASMLGKTPHHISVVIHELKKEQTTEGDSTNQDGESQGGTTNV